MYNFRDYLSMIRWNKYSEDEIRNILKIHYDEMGYIVNDLHKADRRGEKGADLIIFKKNEAEKTAIAIKIKPKKSDLYQLNELSEREEKHKKYIYVKTPATDFYDKIPKYDKKVDFWDSEKLTYEISSNNIRLAIWLAAANHPLILRITRMNCILLNIYYKYRNKEKFNGKGKTDSALLQNMWRLKDDISNLNKSFSLLHKIFGSGITKDSRYKLNPNSPLSILETILDELDDSVHEPDVYLSDIIKKYGIMVRNVIEKTYGRSNWGQYLNFGFSFIPNKTSTELYDDLIPKNKRTSLFKYKIDYDFDKHYFDPNDAFVSLFGSLHAEIDSIEYFIDNIFELVIQDIFKK